MGGDLTPAAPIPSIAPDGSRAGRDHRGASAGRRGSSAAGVMPAAREILRQAAGLEEAREGAGKRRRQHDAVAALAGEPPEAGRRRVLAHDRAVVGDEAAQARPAVRDARDLECRRALEPIDQQRHVELVGLGVAGRRRRGVAGRGHEPAAVGLDVVVVAGIVDRGPAPRVLRAGLDDDRGAAFRHETDRRHAGERRHLVRPGAGGIDENGRARLVVAGADPPRAGPLLDAARFRVGRERAAARLEALEEALVQRRHLDVGDARLVGAARDRGRPQDRRQRERALRRDLDDLVARTGEREHRVEHAGLLERSRS